MGGLHGLSRQVHLLTVPDSGRTGISALFHLRTQLDGFTRDRELSVSKMMDGTRMLHCRVDPRLDDFHDEQAVTGHLLPAAHPAFEICMVFLDKRCRQYAAGTGVGERPR